MKVLITLLSLLILISSCNIEKRRYTKGYYIHKNQNSEIKPRILLAKNNLDVEEVRTSHCIQRVDTNTSRENQKIQSESKKLEINNNYSSNEFYKKENPKIEKLEAIDSKISSNNEYKNDKSKNKNNFRQKHGLPWKVGAIVGYLQLIGGNVLFALSFEVSYTRFLPVITLNPSFFAASFLLLILAIIIGIRILRRTPDLNLGQERLIKALIFLAVLSIITIIIILMLFSI